MTDRVFPPSLVPLLRDRWTRLTVSDGLLVHLLTTVFFAALETYEGEHGAIRVVFIGTSRIDVVMPDGAAPNATPLYAWKILRFETPRRFEIAELVKLAVASANERLYAAVSAAEDGRLAIAGLAREGLRSDADPFIEVVAARPGCLSIRSGRIRLLEYERGAIVSGGDDVFMAEGPVRHALAATAGEAGIELDGVADYLHAVQALVNEMTAHGRGGILVISAELDPHVAEAAAYRMTRDSSIASMLRLSRRIRRAEDASSYGFLLRSAFINEVQRMVEEYGALTAIDGATILDRCLALVAFGAVLPVGARTTIDLGARGTRHRAAVTYAMDHPGSVVFVASENGEVSCMLRDPAAEHVVVRRLGQ